MQNQGVEGHRYSRVSTKTGEVGEAHPRSTTGEDINDVKFTLTGRAQWVALKSANSVTVETRGD
jgi:hypothetical protein